jgi:hypothetical protein
MSTAVDMQQANKQAAISEQRLGKHVPAETNTHAAVDLCWKWVFSMWTAQMSYKENWGKLSVEL